MTLLQIIVTAMLAMIGASLTFAQFQTARVNGRLDQENKRFEIMERLSQKCMSKNQAERDQALQVAAFFSKEGNKKAWTDPNVIPSDAVIQKEKAETLWAKIFNRNPEPEADLSFDNINRTCANWVFQLSAKVAEPGASDSKSSSPPSPPETPHPGDARWVYLGTYKGSRWETWYLDQLPAYDPSKFVTPKAAQSLPVMTVREQTGALNLRAGSFSDSGAFPAVSGSLSPKDQVKILNTWQWFNSGNWWAKVTLPKLSSATRSSPKRRADDKADPARSLGDYWIPDGMHVNSEHQTKMLECIGADATARSLLAIVDGADLAAKQSLAACLRTGGEKLN